MFKEASLRLTAWYLAIIMLISVAFSVALFQVATREVSFGLRTPPTLNNNPANPFLDNGITGQNFDELRLERVSESRERILNDLLIFNAIILLAGGAISYALARRTLEPIEEVHNSQSRFTADAAHELRTPLSAMRSEIEVALRAPKITDQEARELLHSNLEEVSRLTVLSESLLKLARYQHSLPASLLEKNNAKKIINDVLKNIHNIIAAKNITVTQKITAPELFGDASLLSELLTIIIENAVKYSPEKSKILITAKNAGDHTKLTVTDQGIGIAAKDLPHIFDRFYRADTSRGVTQGYGLGLAIAAEIVKLHNGKITVNSTPNTGTEIIIALPQASA